MPRFVVHTFMGLRVKSKPIEAATAQEAIKKSGTSVDWQDVQRKIDSIVDVPGAEYVDGEGSNPTGYMVDTVAAEDEPDPNVGSEFFGPDFEPNCLGYEQLFMRIIEHPEILPTLVGIDESLDRFIDWRLKHPEE